MQRVGDGHVVQHLVERLGVVLDHPLNVTADADAQCRHAGEREGVEVVVGHHDERVGLRRREPLAHPGNLDHGGFDLLPSDRAAGVIVVVGIEHV